MSGLLLVLLLGGCCWLWRERRSPRAQPAHAVTVRDQLSDQRPQVVIANRQQPRAKSYDEKRVSDSLSPHEPQVPWWVWSPPRTTALPSAQGAAWQGTAAASDERRVQPREVQPCDRSMEVSLVHSPSHMNELLTAQGQQLIFAPAMKAWSSPASPNICHV
jgi:hypothetical protein